MSPIKMDLRDLTPQHLLDAQKGKKNRSYSGPCLLGTLISPEDRRKLDEDLDYSSITHLAGSAAVVDMPHDQHELAQSLQCAFDCEEYDLVLDLMEQINHVTA